MDYAKEMHDLCDTLSREVAEANEKIRTAGGKLSAGDLDYIDKLTHSLKSVKSIISMMDESGYSNHYPMVYRGNRDSYRKSGRYTNGYSRSNDLAEELRNLMEDAPDERTRQDMRRLVEKIESTT